MLQERIWKPKGSLSKYSEPVDRIASIISQDEYESVYGIGLDCGWYYRNDIMSAYK